MLKIVKNLKKRVSSSNPVCKKSRGKSPTLKSGFYTKPSSLQFRSKREIYFVLEKEKNFKRQHKVLNKEEAEPRDSDAFKAYKEEYQRYQRDSEESLRIKKGESLCYGYNNTGEVKDEFKEEFAEFEFSSTKKKDSRKEDIYIRNNFNKSHLERKQQRQQTFETGGNGVNAFGDFFEEEEEALNNYLYEWSIPSLNCKDPSKRNGSSIDQRIVQDMINNLTEQNEALRNNINSLGENKQRMKKILKDREKLRKVLEELEEREYSQFDCTQSKE